MLKETARLNFLTNNILIASQLEGGGYQSSKEELDLSDLLKDCIQDFRNRFPERDFRSETEQGVDIKGDALLLQMMINNLLENAVKVFTQRNSRVSSVKERQYVQYNYRSWMKVRELQKKKRKRYSVNFTVSVMKPHVKHRERDLACIFAAR